MRPRHAAATAIEDAAAAVQRAMPTLATRRQRKVPSSAASGERGPSWRVRSSPFRLLNAKITKSDLRVRMFGQDLDVHVTQGRAYAFADERLDKFNRQSSGAVASPAAGACCTETSAAQGPSSPTAPRVAYGSLAAESDSRRTPERHIARAGPAHHAACAADHLSPLASRRPCSARPALCSSAAFRPCQPLRCADSLSWPRRIGMEVRWRVAAAVTALKLLLVPAYRSTDFEASRRHPSCPCKEPVAGCAGWSQ